MSVQNSLQWVTEFWKNNQKLVEQIQKTGKDVAAEIKDVADAVKSNQEQAVTLAAALGTKFAVAQSDAVKQRQQELIKQIEDLNQQIQEFRNSPEITSNLLTDRSTLYEALAQTFDNSVEEFVEFTPAEIAEINGLLKEAALDSASRQRWAKVLDATVALTQMALKIAIKVAAA